MTPTESMKQKRVVLNLPGPIFHGSRRSPGLSENSQRRRALKRSPALGVTSDEKTKHENRFQNQEQAMHRNNASHKALSKRLGKE